MQYTIGNNEMTAIFSNYGGELISLKNNATGIDYIWCGNEQFWKYHSPTLFPIIGGLNNGKFILDGKEYFMEKHGIARLSTFTCKNEGDNFITFELEADEKTLLTYPFNFKLRIEYTLENYKLHVKYVVENIDTKKMFFQIGAHPAFNIPFSKNSDYEDYYLEFEQKETLDTFMLSKDNLITSQRLPFLQNESRIPITKTLFEQDALIFSNIKSNYVTLASKKESTKLRFYFSEFPILAFWALPNNPPFICIEPWHGHSDLSGFQGELKDKEKIKTLEIGEKFQTSYSFEIFSK